MYLLYILGGFVFILFGLVTILEGGFHHFGDFIEGKIPGVAALIFGAISIRIGLKSVSSESSERPIQKYMKCISCGNVVRMYNDERMSCPICSSKVEDLKDFFDRHPEFKKDERKGKKKVRGD